jgi:hypothetical protein
MTEITAPITIAQTTISAPVGVAEAKQLLNLDGGTPTSIYGGTNPIDGGTPDERSNPI